MLNNHYTMHFVYSFSRYYTHQQVIYLWRFFPLSLVSTWRSGWAIHERDNEGSHLNLHAQLRRSNSASRRCLVALFERACMQVTLIVVFIVGVDMDGEKKIERKFVSVERERKKSICGRVSFGYSSNLFQKHS